MLGRAVKSGIVSIDVTDIRDYAHDPHHTADDYQFGGGHGMIIKPDPVFEATEALLSKYTEAERTGESPCQGSTAHRGADPYQ